MADDLDKKIKQIADMFGVSDTSGLKNIVENIMPSGASQEPPSTSSSSDSSSGDYDNAIPASNFRNNGINAGILNQAQEMMRMLNNVTDSRITLLNSVQPFLGPQRQQRLGGAIQLLKVINIISAISPTINRNPKG
jgi:hypothetical protein